jgi:A/G-specific adenine glycosylase
MLLIINDDNAILLYRRPSSGLWGGLWSPPELDSIEQLDGLADRHGLVMENRQALPGLTHTFSHFQLAIEPWLIHVDSRDQSMTTPEWLWYNLATPPRLGLAAPIKKLLKRAEEALKGESV